jgi:membrane protease YdiL (CAAX protease family)
MPSTTLRIIGLAVLALVIALFPGGVWTALLIINLRLSPNIPWAVVAMVVFLWVMWRYLGGWGPPRANSETRHRLLRARAIPAPVFGWALVAGLLSIVALAGFWIVLLQLVKVPLHPLPDFSKYPLLTVTTVVVMACVVSSVPEEAGFRGYFQSFTERRLPAAGAIMLSSLVLAPGHCATQGFVWPVVLFYFLVDSMLGTMAYLTKSILPSIAVHFLGLLIFFTLVWPQDGTRSLVRDVGPGLWFWIHLSQLVICGLLALLSFHRLTRVTRALRGRPDL